MLLPSTLCVIPFFYKSFLVHDRDIVWPGTIYIFFNINYSICCVCVIAIFSKSTQHCFSVTPLWRWTSSLFLPANKKKDYSFPRSVPEVLLTWKVFCNEQLLSSIWIRVITNDVWFTRGSGESYFWQFYFN
jgi:hypothetical protein